MHWRNEASVIVHNGKDYWRTWFLEECEATGLFGINERYIPLVAKDVPGTQKAYSVGREIYLEDAPYFNKTKTYHRICGPYLIKASRIGSGDKAILRKKKEIIIYKAKVPSNGLWFDKSYVRRNIDGIDVKFRQLAKAFGYFPFRFSIEKSPDYRVRHIKHEPDCWVCVK